MNLACGLCPHNCSLAPGQWGFCGVRKNTGAAVEDAYYACLSGLSMDPIEKKPLYHFFPGQTILSAGFFGCSFRCPFCQNFSISQTGTQDVPPSEKLRLAPESLVKAALDERSFGIAYTYSEPLIHFEYLLDSAKLARKNGLKNVLISNGFINPEPAKKLLPWIDAANVDLKSFNPEFYRKEIKGDLEAVKNFITLSHDKIHLEITTLVIPGKNDSPEEIRAISSFIAGHNPEIPLHLSAYHPAYRYQIPSTSRKSILRLVDIAREKLRFVYPGNI